MKVLAFLFLFYGTSVCFAQLQDDQEMIQNEFPKKENYFVSVGPAIQSANGAFWGARAALGVDVQFSKSIPFLTEFSIMHPFIHEKIEGKYSGLIYRYYGFLGVKYFTSENKSFYVNARLGLGTIHNSNPSQPFFMKMVYGATVGYKIYELSPDKKVWLDLSYDYMPTVRFNSMSSSWFCGAGQPLGDDPKECENQLIPNSHIISLSGTMTFDVK